VTIPEHIVGGLLVFFAGACALYWTVGLVKILDGLFGGFSARRGLSLPVPRNDSGEHPIVCVVVPCYNEQEAVGPLVRTLRAQDYPALRVVFALDRCTDDTRAVIEREARGDERFEIVEITRCPEAWSGKVHAMHTGVRSSRSAQDADYILFIDADCELEPGCIRATLAIAHMRSLGLLSLWSTLTRTKWFEKIVQPATTMELIRQFPLQAANRSERRRPMANGQFMLFERSAYERVGGIESVRESVLEDVDIARRMKHAGLSSGVLIADGLLVCRMYDDFASFKRGWERIFIECARRKSSRLVAFARRKFIVHLALPGLSLAALAWGVILFAIDGPALSAWVLTLAGVAGTLPYWTSMGVLLGAQGLILYLPALPIGTATTIGIMLSAARTLREGGVIRWGGREYRLVDESAAPSAESAPKSAVAVAE
jgi:glycosyltransferase involved in cell wall biosynthesis